MNSRIAGHLAELPVAEVFHRLGTRNQSGLIVFRNRSLRKDVMVLDGSVVWAKTNRKDERFGDFLLSKGAISYRHYQEMTRRLNEGKVGEILVRSGALPAQSLPSYLQGQALEIILDVFDWEDGEFVFTPDSDIKPAGTYPPISWRSLVVQGIRKIRYWGKVEGALQHVVDRAFKVANGANIDGLVFDRNERAILELFRTPRRLDDLIGKTENSDFQLMKGFWTLWLVGALEIHLAEPKSRGPAAAEPDPGHSVAEEQLLQFAAAMETLDDLAVLGVKSGVSQGEVREAYLRRVMEFHPDRVKDPVLRPLCERIMMRVLKAGKNCLKEAALTHVTYAATPPDAGSGAVFAAPAASPQSDLERRRSAEETHDRGQLFMNAGDFHNGIECFRRAVRLIPRDAIFRLSLGRALTTNPRWLGEAESELRQALEMDPRNVDILIALGRVHRLSGRTPLAYAFLRKALLYHPDHLDAVAEITTLTDTAAYG